MRDKVLDVEIEMHAFRLMRSGNCRTAKELLEEMKTTFPYEDEERIHIRLAVLANRLMEQA